MIAVTVWGLPVAQGSKRYIGNGVSIESSKALRPWRADVKDALERALPPGHTPHEGPLAVGLVFAFPRPKSHWRTGKNSHLLKDSAPAHPASSRNDLDKLCRAILDATTAAGVWKDDGYVVQLGAVKEWVGTSLDRPGAHIRIHPIDDDRSST